MRKATLPITGALLITALSRILAQSAAAKFNSNSELPFVRLIRPDRPGQTITTNRLYPGQFQLETSLTHDDAGGNASYAGRQVWGNTRRVGFFNHIELRASQNCLPNPTNNRQTPSDAPAISFAGPAGFAPLNMGAKFLGGMSLVLWAGYS